MAHFDVFGINRNLVRSGYVQVLDVRGTGASQGKWQILGMREQKDSLELIDWVTTQKWCNGRVGMAGWSYSLSTHCRPLISGRARWKRCSRSRVVRTSSVTSTSPAAWPRRSSRSGWAWSTSPRVPNPRTLMHDMGHGDTARWLRDRVKSPATEIPSLLWGFDDPRRTHLRRPVLR